MQSNGSRPQRSSKGLERIRHLYKATRCCPNSVVKNLEMVGNQAHDLCVDGPLHRTSCLRIGRFEHCFWPVYGSVKASAFGLLPEWYSFLWAEALWLKCARRHKQLMHCMSTRLPSTSPCNIVCVTIVLRALARQSSIPVPRRNSAPKEIPDALPPRRHQPPRVDSFDDRS